MNRKWIVLGATMVSVAVLSTGLSVAQDKKDSPLAKLMEKVQKSNATILKNIRTSIAYKKAQKDVVEQAEELTKLGKEARVFKEPAQEQKKSQEEWTTLMDAFIKSSEEFATEVGKSGTDQVKAKAAYKNVSKQCTACHEVFRVDDEF